MKIKLSLKLVGWIICFQFIQAIYGAESLHEKLECLKANYTKNCRSYYFSNESRHRSDIALALSKDATLYENKAALIIGEHHILGLLDLFEQANFTHIIFTDFNSDVLEHNLLLIESIKEASDFDKFKTIYESKLSNPITPIWKKFVSWESFILSYYHLCIHSYVRIEKAKPTPEDCLLSDPIFFAKIKAATLKLEFHSININLFEESECLRVNKIFKEHLITPSYIGISNIYNYSSNMGNFIPDVSKFAPLKKLLSSNLKIAINYAVREQAISSRVFRSLTVISFDVFEKFLVEEEIPRARKAFTEFREPKKKKWPRSKL